VLALSRLAGLKGFPADVGTGQSIGLIPSTSFLYAPSVLSLTSERIEPRTRDPCTPPPCSQRIRQQMVGNATPHTLGETSYSARQIGVTIP
jgi:hypothetical protein